jgi:hypothetical protein
LVGRLPVRFGASKRVVNYRDRVPLINRALPRGAFSRPHTSSGGPSSPLQPSETGHFFLLVPLWGTARRQGAPGQPTVAHHPARQPETEFPPHPVRSPLPEISGACRASCWGLNRKNLEVPALVGEDSPIQSTICLAARLKSASSPRGVWASRLSWLTSVYRGEQPKQVR